MLQDLLRRVMNGFKGLACLGAAIAAVWRGNAYTSNHPGITAPVMCMLFAISVAMTVLAMTIPPGEG